MLLMTLWLFTSTYATPLATFPYSDAGKTLCAVTAVSLAENFKETPKPFLFRLACIASVEGMQPRRAQPSSGDGPTALR